MERVFKPFFGKQPIRPNLMTYPILAEGIEWEVLQENICSFLGPEAYARIHINQGGIRQYLITTMKPFTNSQLNDLRAFSAEMIEDGIHFQSQNHHHTNAAYIYQAYYNGTPGSGLNSLENREINNPRTQGSSIVLQIFRPVVHNTYITSTSRQCNHSATRCHNCISPEQSRGIPRERRGQSIDSQVSSRTSNTLY